MKALKILPWVIAYGVSSAVPQGFRTLYCVLYFAVLLLFLLRHNREVTAVSLRDALTALPMLLIPAVSLFYKQSLNPILLINVFVCAFCEEVFFRYYLYNEVYAHLKNGKYGIIFSTLICVLAFALFHFVNALTDKSFSLLTLPFAFCIGFGLQASTKKSVTAQAVIHFLINALYCDSGVAVALSVLYLLYGIILLKDKNKNEFVH